MRSRAGLPTRPAEGIRGGAAGDGAHTVHPRRQPQGRHLHLEVQQHDGGPGHTARADHQRGPALHRVVHAHERAGLRYAPVFGDERAGRTARALCLSRCTGW